ncbi:MAG: type II toxin-antitoxin system HicB family antitoxin [Planctomycetaceae bacterium]|nr:type II toxin-antitoxin system HicB family antitoxin [Planctomycetaceae bacterium]
MDKHYTVSDGTLMLYLWPAEEGGYNVTSPMDPELITQAETLEEAFINAYDAQELLIQWRAELARRHTMIARCRSRETEANPDNTASPMTATEVAPLPSVEAPSVGSPEPMPRTLDFDDDAS